MTGGVSGQGVNALSRSEHRAWRLSQVDWQISFAFKQTSAHGSLQFGDLHRAAFLGRHGYLDDGVYPSNPPDVVECK